MSFDGSDVLLWRHGDDASVLCRRARWRARERGELVLVYIIGTQHQRCSEQSLGRHLETIVVVRETQLSSPYNNL